MAPVFWRDEAVEFVGFRVPSFRFRVCMIFCGFRALGSSKVVGFPFWVEALGFRV